MPVCVECLAPKVLRGQKRQYWLCLPCAARKNKQWRASNRDYKREADAARYQASQANVRKRVKEHRLFAKYGLTVMEREQLIRGNGGRCWCCNRDLNLDLSYEVCVDHDHANGRVRGILCRGCNSGIGQLGDTLTGVSRAVSYLERSQEN